MTATRAVRRLSSSAFALSKPSIDQYGEIPQLLRQLMGGNGDRGCDPQPGVLDKRCSDDHAVDEVVDAVADQVDISEGMGFASPLVAVAPAEKPLHEEENNDSREGVREEGGVAGFNRLREEVQEGAAE